MLWSKKKKKKKVDADKDLDLDQDLDVQKDADLDQDLDVDKDADLDKDLDKDLEKDLDVDLEKDLDLEKEGTAEDDASALDKEEEEKEPSKYRARNDAYTGMLAISLLALAGGCALIFLDYQKYDYGTKPPKVEQVKVLSGETPKAPPKKGEEPAGKDGGAPKGDVPE